MRYLLRYGCLVIWGLVIWYLPLPAAPASSSVSLTSVWQDTGITLPAGYNRLCLDAVHPDVFLTTEPGSGTVAYDWRTGRRTVINARPFLTCGPAGFLFASDYTYGRTRGWRFSLDDPQEQPVDYIPGADSIASDGSLQIYSSTYSETTMEARLLTSLDAGRTWALQQPSAIVALRAVGLSPRDANVMYLGFWSPPIFSTPPPGYVSEGTSYGISTDGGQQVAFGATVREARGAAGPGIVLRPALERFGSSQTVLKITSYGSGQNYGYDYSISADGLHTFQEIGFSSQGLSSQRGLDLAATPAGLVRLASQDTITAVPAQVHVTFDLTRSADAGQTWQPLPAPVPVSTTLALSSGGNPIHILGTKEVPSILLFRLGVHLYQSTDNGDTWQALPDYSGDQQLYLTPYAPVTLLDIRADGRVFALPLAAPPATFLAPVPASAAPGSRYFPETGHTLDRAQAAYWQAHGGLAQLGYPLTEAFHQVSATDGRVYMTQYLERAVMERHPENNPPYDILLSLLGVTAYQQRYGAAGAPDQHPNADNARSFAETGHTLGGRFRAYWEAHGGLAQQGYPISEEFREVNALNATPYTVQYFQRAVFEYHPENQPPFDVLLSQLGTLRARQLGQAQPSSTPTP